MSWFFPVSKIAGFLIAPSHVLLWLVLGAAAALLFGHIQAGRVLALAGAAGFLLIGVAPAGALLARPLEDRYPRQALPARVDGVLVLGGGLGARILMARAAPGAAPSLGRVVAAYALARQHPQARVVFSGGWPPYPDTVAAEDELRGMGLDSARLVLEDRSRNTYENLAFSKALVHPRPGETWVLATSAIQLPRAMQVAKRLGWPLIPWPTDYTTTPDRWPGGWFQIAGNLELTDEAAHEWIGLAAYGWTGLARS